MERDCKYYSEINCLEDLCGLCDSKYSALLEAAIWLLDAYVEENGGDMPSNDDHPAHMMKRALNNIGPEE